MTTVIAQASQERYVWFISSERFRFKTYKEDWKLDGTLVKIQFGIGFPMAFQYSITAIGAMMMLVFSEYPGFRGDCRIYGGQQDRAAGNTGVCGAGNDDGNLLCPEYGGRKDSQDSTGI